MHTSRSELYQRLWCVFELHKGQQNGVETFAACSPLFTMHVHGKSDLEIDTEDAECGNPSDEEMIRDEIESCDGYECINRSVTDFRVHAVSTMLKQQKSFGKWEKQLRNHGGFLQQYHRGDASEFLREAVGAAMEFVSLHCLYTVSGRREDKALLPRATQLLSYFLSPRFIAPVLPPGFDPRKLIDGMTRQHLVQMQSTRQLGKAAAQFLSDLTRFPCVIGLLEMSQGV